MQLPRFSQPVIFLGVPFGQAIRYKSSLRSGLSAAVLHAPAKKLLKPQQYQSTYQAPGM